MQRTIKSGYNERLFGAGLRGYFHTARFRWLASALLRVGCVSDSVLEIGCFDGKVLDILPTPPRTYLGLDADWEGGLGIAQERWAHKREFSFRPCCTPRQMREAVGGRRFDISIAMETFEHVPPGMVDQYLCEIAACTSGFLFLTVPNEKGVPLLVKRLVKRLTWRDAQVYTNSEFLNAVLGRMDKVERVEHKGFDYARFIEEVRQHFDVIEVSGHPLGLLPTSLCFGVGIVAKVR